MHRVSERWDCYSILVDDEPAVICLDLALRERAPIPGAHTMVWIRVWFRSADERGFPVGDEFDRLSELEDAILAAVGQDAVFAGRATFGGHRDFFFYGADGADLESRLVSAVEGCGDDHYETGHRLEPDWHTYFEFLYPAPRSYQVMMNRHVLDALVESGDRHEIARQVDHWIYFDAEEDRSRFCAGAFSLGYSVRRQDGDDECDEECEEESEQLCVIVSSVIPVDPETIDRVVLELFDVAEECGGNYDGWETSVECGESTQ